MLRVLVASQPVHIGWLASTFSTVTHGALIAAAVVATSQTATAVREKHAAEHLERITYVEPAVLAEAMRRAVEEARAKAARKAAAEEQQRRDDALAALRKLTDQPFDVSTDVAQADLTAVVNGWVTRPDRMDPPKPPSVSALLAQRAGFLRPADGVYDEDMVERNVEPQRGNPKPSYPVTLASMGVDGTFIVRFVVDSTGSVPADKIEFPSTMNRLFVSAVRSALLKSHYVPAMIGGHGVAMQVVQEFRFETRQRR